MPTNSTKTIKQIDREIRIRRFISTITLYKYLKHDVIKPLARVIKWIPVLWKDYGDDDYIEFLKIMKFKIGLMKKDYLKNMMLIAEDHRSSHYEYLFRADKLTADLLDETYFDRYHAMFVKHYGGFPVHKIDMDGKFTKEENQKGYRVANITTDWSSVSPEKLEIAKKVYARFNPTKYESIRYKNDIRELTSILQEHMTFWYW